VVVLTEKAKYKMDKMDKFNADTVKAFIGEYAAGKLEVLPPPSLPLI
jgi:hypothetical protein